MSINSVYTSVTRTDGPYSQMNSALYNHLHFHTHSGASWIIHSKLPTDQIKSLKLAQQSGLGQQAFKRRSREMLGCVYTHLVLRCDCQSDQKWTFE